jgi:geranyl-CoA carboxylase alpha subunit
MGAAAVAAAQSRSITPAPAPWSSCWMNGKFYFLEMNTRLQVEHPVTELITGLDLVALADCSWRRASRCRFTQGDVTLTGHAIEVRLYAEDPANNSCRKPGRSSPGNRLTGDGVRIDHGIQSPAEKSARIYDPMVAKVIAWGDTREDARRRLIRALEDTALIGFPTNKRFLLAILRNDMFASGKFGTAFIAEVDGRTHSALKPVTGWQHRFRTGARTVARQREHTTQPAAAFRPVCRTPRPAG